MELRIIEAGSIDYQNMIALRMEVLLNPIGIPVHFINQENEKQDILIGAFENEVIIGCCILTRQDQDTVQLRQMAVSDREQGKGLGREILKFAEKIAKQNNYCTLMMHAREDVAGFYINCGYEQSGDVFEEVGIRHIKMVKQLC